jgi:histone H2A
LQFLAEMNSSSFESSSGDEITKIDCQKIADFIRMNTGIDSSSAEDAPDVPSPSVNMEVNNGGTVPAAVAVQPRGIGAGKKAIKMADRRPRQQRMSASSRAGLVFPVTRIRKFLKSMQAVGGLGGCRVSATSAVYLSAIMEHLTAEVLGLAQQATFHQRKKIITPRFINLAVKEDIEVNALLKNVTISGGGVVPNIHGALVKKKKEPRTRKR